MQTIVPKNTLQKLNKDDLNRYLFKIETKGDVWTTQDVKIFRTEFEYKKVENLDLFAEWLIDQPKYAQKLGYYEEVTEIWEMVSQNTMKLIWKKENER